MYSEAKKIAKKSKSSFYYAFNLMPASKREAMNTVYAFCRETDDIVDENDFPESTKYLNLKEWEFELKNALEGSSQKPLLNNLSKIINEFSIPTEPFFALIKGMEMDIEQTRFQSFDDLLKYCYRVAATVGLMSIEIFGYKNSLTRKYAINLGYALQLTNIIRDVKKDAAIGRIYLPLEDLKKFNYSEDELFSNVYNENFVSLMQFETERAKTFFEKANRALDIGDRRSLFAARAMQHIYFNLLKKIERKKFNLFSENIKVSKVGKVAIAIGVWVKYNLIY